MSVSFNLHLSELFWFQGEDHVDRIEADLQSSLPSTSSKTSVAVPASRPTGQYNKRLSIHERLAIEFHEHKLKYLREEHEMKMKILQVELEMKIKERDAQMSQMPQQYINL